MLTMTCSAVFSIAALSLGAFAQEDLDSFKQKATSHLDEKSSIIQTAKSCINNAESLDAAKACKYDMKKDLKHMKHEKLQAQEEKQEDKKDEKQKEEDKKE